ncbi:MAG: hypothetical protein JRD47_04895 [Deltaproteobacteria bacterium]|jgi:hypothetical protein|nr:hypothetical protein [Deltaproteobacteria bacterium]MBW2601253.1 hypothetical protein [Deltaproteobacteria bacterium]OEU45224.1 MAG: hypothetical protein BBJ60_00755 [Desulfobacterales bacterium S7086C20]
MSLKSIQQEEEDRIQYELLLAGSGGKRYKPSFVDKDRKEKQEPGPIRVNSSDDYILTLEKVGR